MSRTISKSISVVSIKIYLISLALKFLDVLVSCQWEDRLMRRSPSTHLTENNANENENQWDIGNDGSWNVNGRVIPFGTWRLIMAEKRGETPSATLERNIPDRFGKRLPYFDTTVFRLGKRVTIPLHHQRGKEVARWGKRYNWKRYYGAVYGKRNYGAVYGKRENYNHVIKSHFPPFSVDDE